MGPRNPTALLIAALLCAVLASRCGMSPTVADGGGTHTGNPDISACASALFDIMESGGSWHVYAYVDTARLNPNAIDPPAGGDVPVVFQSGLAKTASAASETTIVLIYDTLFVNDTLVSTHVRADTVDTVFGADTLTYVTRTLFYDTLVAVDTVVIVDTVVFVDSGVMNTAAPSEAAYIIYDSVNRGMAPQSGGTVDSSKIKLIPSMAGDVIGRSGVYVTPAGTRVSIEYADADGDNLLFTATQGRVPVMRINESRISGAGRIDLVAQFNSGDDGLWATTGDNGVLSFSLCVVENGDTVETAALNARSDSTVVLTTYRRMSADIVFSRKSRFDIITAGTASPADDRLTSVEQTLVYRKGDVDKAVISCTPQEPLARGAAMTTARFSAVITLENGDTTRLDGVVDAAAGITAVYESGGKTYDVTVERTGAVDIVERK